MKKIKVKRTKTHVKITEMGLTDPLEFESFIESLTLGKEDINRIIGEGVIAGLNKVENLQNNEEKLREITENIVNSSEKRMKKHKQDYQFIVANGFIRSVKERYDIDLKNCYIFRDGIFHWKKEFEDLISGFYI